MGLRFIFMLTRNDRTVDDAAHHLRVALDAGVRHVGFKDVGLPVEALKMLNTAIKIGRATSYLEVVSLDRESELRSARAAVEIGVDCLLGGTHVDDVLPVLAGTDILYFPFAGSISGHPSQLEGGIEDITRSAVALAARDGVHGLDLLAYRSQEDVPTLMAEVCAAVDKPVIMAGSIDNAARIGLVFDAGAAGFTIGTAALDLTYSAGEDVAAQLAAIMRDVAAINRHISPHRKHAVGAALKALPPWVSQRFGTVGGLRVEAMTFEGPSVWHFHTREDELFYVLSGSLLMRYRDREERLEAGDLIVVPRGVEHCPEAVGGPCQVMLIRPPGVDEPGPAPADDAVATAIEDVTGHAQGDTSTLV
ncbi:MAG: cupin domain-containing protein [Pseudomonadota bacterium]